MLYCVNHVRYDEALERYIPVLMAQVSELLRGSCTLPGCGYLQ
jgi:hypothetical protein